MYGIDGEQDLTERTLDHLHGLRRREAGADRQRRLRPAPERRLRRGARLGLPAHQGQRLHPRAAVAGARRPRSRRRIEVWKRARPGDLGGARRAQALRLLQAHVLGGDGPRRAAGRHARRAEEAEGWARRWPTRSAPTSSSTASDDAASSASTTTPTRSTPRRCSSRSCASCPPTTSACARPCWRSRDELTEHGLVLRYKVDETDDGLHGQEGTFLICSFWLVSRAVGDRRARAAPARSARSCSRYASPLQLYAEEIDADSGRHLGQLPAGVHPPGADQRRPARHRRRAARRIGWPGAPASLRGGRLGLLQGRPRGLRLHRTSCSRTCATTTELVPKFRKADTIVQYQYSQSGLPDHREDDRRRGRARWTSGRDRPGARGRDEHGGRHGPQVLARQGQRDRRARPRPDEGRRARWPRSSSSCRSSSRSSRATGAARGSRAAPTSSRP